MPNHEKSPRAQPAVSHKPENAPPQSSETAASRFLRQARILATTKSAPGAPLAHARYEPTPTALRDADLSSLYRSGIVGIIVGEDDRILEANDTFLSMVGYTREDLGTGGLPWVEMTPSEYHAADEAGLEAMLKVGYSGPVEKQYIRKDGRRVSVVIGGVTLRTLPFRWMSIVIDITERVMSERRLKALYQERDHMARVLQRTLLPSVLPTVSGAELAVRYIPFSTGLDVGGDFYDVFTPRPNTWVLMIGDVSGKGVGSAALVSVARMTAAAVAKLRDRPSYVLKSVNEAMLREGEPERFCTAALVRLVRRDYGFRATISLGGHPPALVLRNNGDVTSVGKEGAVLGLFPDIGVFDARIDLHPGDALVLHTDGLVEGGSTDEDDVSAALSRCVGADADSIAEELLALRAGGQGAPLRDDVALLVLRVAPSAAGDAGAPASTSIGRRGRSTPEEPPERSDATAVMGYARHQAPPRHAPA